MADYDVIGSYNSFNVSGVKTDSNTFTLILGVHDCESVSMCLPDSSNVGFVQEFFYDYFLFYSRDADGLFVFGLTVIDGVVVFPVAHVFDLFNVVSDRQFEDAFSVQDRKLYMGEDEYFGWRDRFVKSMGCLSAACTVKFGVR